MGIRVVSRSGGDFPEYLLPSALVPDEGVSKSLSLGPHCLLFQFLNRAISKSSSFIGVSVGQLRFKSAISSSESSISNPVSESKIEEDFDAPGIGIDVGN